MLVRVRELRRDIHHSIHCAPCTATNTQRGYVLVICAVDCIDISGNFKQNVRVVKRQTMFQASQQL
jgi:hypothetical protein